MDRGNSPGRLNQLRFGHQALESSEWLSMTMRLQGFSNVARTGRIDGRSNRSFSTRTLSSVHAQSVYPLASVEDRRVYFAALLDWSNIATNNDCFGIKSQQILEDDSSHMLSEYYQNSFLKALEALYPEYNWLGWKFEENVYSGYWGTIDNQRKYFNWLMEELKLDTLSDWYRISLADIKDQHGATLLSTYYKDSLYSALRSLYPDYPWNAKLFQKLSLHQRRHYSQILSKQNQRYQRTDMLQFIETHQSRDAGHDPDHSNSSHVNPNPTHVKKGYWRVRENQEKYLQWLEQQLKIKQPEDWYQVKVSDVRRVGGGSLLMCFGGSLLRTLQSLYPQRTWYPWLFTAVAPGYWNKMDNQITYLDWLAKELDIQQPNDWYHVKLQQVARRGGSGLLARYGGSLMTTLKAVYKDDPLKFPASNRLHKSYTLPKGVSKTQLRLMQLTQKLFPSDPKIYVNYTHPQLIHQDTGYPIELDLFIPSLQIAFEYHGEQHYKQRPVFGEVSTIHRKDENRRKACMEHGIKLIEIPFWWDGELASLRRIIAHHQPSLQLNPDPSHNSPTNSRMLPISPEQVPLNRMESLTGQS